MSHAYERTPEPAAPLGTAERIGASCMLLSSMALMFLGADAWNARWAAGRTVQLETLLDRQVPFVPAFIFVYAAYYLWLGLPLVIARSRDQFYRAVTALLLMQVLALFVFVAYPTHIDRPDVLGTGVAAWLVRQLYAIDRGFNLLPSLHVAHAIFVAGFARAVVPRWFPVVALGSALISASTVLVKQHYVLDIPAGAMLALLASAVAPPLYARGRLASRGLRAYCNARTRRV